MKPFPIPVVAFDSPEATEAADYPPMPQMETFAMPQVAISASAAAYLHAAEIVERVADSLAAPIDPSDPPLMRLDAVPEDVREVLNQSLGQGEVSILIEPAPGELGARIQETAFAGVWRVMHIDATGASCADYIEPNSVPRVAMAALGRVPMQAHPLPAFDPGVMNARPILAEVRHRSGVYRRTGEAHVFNLTLLPLTPQDQAAIADDLGAGPVRILSRGFGNCLIASTGLAHVWRVQYSNTMNTVILDTIEVTGVPEAAIAAPEDLRDSGERLRELVDWLRQDAGGVAA